MGEQLGLWNEKCEICLKGKFDLVWEPFSPDSGMSLNLEKFSEGNMIGICRACENRIFMLRRASAEAFSEAATIAEVLQIVRKGFNL